MSTYSEIISNLQNALPSLSNVSQTAVFKKIAEVISGFIDLLKLEFSNTENIIDDTIVNQRYGSIGYYIEKALAYQVGIQQSIKDNKYYYETIDETKLLIKQAAVQKISNENGDYLTLKVAKLENDILVKLTTEEKSAFDSYFQTHEIPGIPVTKVSLDANIYDFNLTVSYLSSSDLTTLKTNVEAALITFRDTFLFNSKLCVNDLEVYLRANIVGIRNASLSNTSLDNASFSNSIEMPAGYFNYSSDILTKITYEQFS